MLAIFEAINVKMTVVRMDGRTYDRSPNSVKIECQVARNFGNKNGQVDKWKSDILKGVAFMSGKFKI